ncbi:DNA alkylation repair protein [Clostridiaceae bacterium M8S5]|nr:DNA alkylation repair protein [Clostridiaceae bacterium M8S5]
MTKEEALDYLTLNSNEKFKKNVVRMGIPEEDSIGVSTGVIRKFAKKIKTSHELAMELWNTGLHEAKLLAVLIMDVNKVDSDTITNLMKDVFSWDLTDHICKNLIVKLPNYEKFIYQWSNSARTYYKRAAYCLIAAKAVNNKDIDEEELDDYFELIRNYSCDERPHVRKAMSWALREIGKLNFRCQDKAIELAYELNESMDKNSKWIGKNALKELETLVSVEERGRLLTSNSKMGKKNLGKI